MKNILVAVDGSDNSKRVVLEAEKIAKLTDGKITILTVTDPIAILGYIDPERSDRDRDLLETTGEYYLKEAQKVIPNFDGEVKTKLKTGSPADEILKEAVHGNYDLIIMGRRGIGVFSRRMLGSVSSKVLNHAHTNVLIVK